MRLRPHCRLHCLRRVGERMEALPQRLGIQFQLRVRRGAEEIIHTSEEEVDTSVHREAQEV